MAQLIERDSNYYVKADEYTIKLDHNRDLYIKTEGMGTYKSFGDKLPTGLDSQEKKDFLIELHKKLQQKMKDVQEDEP